MKAGLSDMSAALFIMSMGLGSLVGPLLGGTIYDAFGGNVDPALYPEQEKTV
jgi:predicted MFS family arabinose efflux permease